MCRQEILFRIQPELFHGLAPQGFQQQLQTGGIVEDIVADNFPFLGSRGSGGICLKDFINVGRMKK